MMKNLFLSSLLIIPFAFQIKAQITVTSTNMPGSNDTIRYSNCNPTSVTYSLTGANYNWDYSNLARTSQGVYDYLPASATPYAFYFTGSGKYGLKIADSIGTGTYQFKNVYNFYKKTTSVFETEGIGFQYSGFPLAAFYSDPDEIYEFPLNYSDHDSSTYHFSVSLGTGMSYSQTGYRITDVDGWGTITTPYESNIPCLRLVSTTYGKDTITYSGFSIPIPDVQRSYKWMATTEKIPVLEISGNYTNNNFTPTQVRYRDNYVSMVGIEKYGNNNIPFNVYPNPCNSNVNISGFTNQMPEITVFDAIGHEVVKGKLNQIDISNLPNGVYFIRIGNTTQKFIKN